MTVSAITNNCDSDSNSESHLAGHLGGSCPSAPSPGLVLFNSEDHSDLVFNVGINEFESWRFPAHSFIVAEASPVFEAIISSSMKTNSGNKPEISVHCQPETFHLMLAYIYKKEVNLNNVSSILNLVPVAHQFELHSLTRDCLSALASKVNNENVLEILSSLRRPHSLLLSLANAQLHLAAESVNNENKDVNVLNDLMSKVTEILDSNATEILSSENLDNIDAEILMEILTRDSLCLANELIAYEAIVRWSCQQCLKQRRELTGENKRCVLGKAIYAVRYLLMSLDDFIKGPFSSDILTEDEKEFLLSKLRSNSRSANSNSSNSPNPNNFDSVSLPMHLLGLKLDVPRAGYQNVNLNNLDVVKTNTVDTIVTLKKNNNIVTNSSGNAVTKKKTASKKLLNGLSGIMICVIQLLD